MTMESRRSRRRSSIGSSALNLEKVVAGRDDTASTCTGTSRSTRSSTSSSSTRKKAARSKSMGMGLGMDTDQGDWVSAISTKDSAKRIFAGVQSALEGQLEGAGDNEGRSSVVSGPAAAVEASKDCADKDGVKDMESRCAVSNGTASDQSPTADNTCSCSVKDSDNRVFAGVAQAVKSGLEEETAKETLTATDQGASEENSQVSVHDKDSPGDEAEAVLEDHNGEEHDRNGGAAVNASDGGKKPKADTTSQTNKSTIKRTLTGGEKRKKRLFRSKSMEGPGILAALTPRRRSKGKVRASALASDGFDHEPLMGMMTSTNDNEEETVEEHPKMNFETLEVDETEPPVANNKTPHHRSKSVLGHVSNFHDGDGFGEPFFDPPPTSGNSPVRRRALRRTKSVEVRSATLDAPQQEDSQDASARLKPTSVAGIPLLKPSTRDSLVSSAFSAAELHVEKDAETVVTSFSNESKTSRSTRSTANESKASDTKERIRRRCSRSPIRWRRSVLRVDDSSDARRGGARSRSPSLSRGSKRDSARSRSRSIIRDEGRHSMRASRSRSRSGTRDDQRGSMRSSRSRSRSGTRDDQRGSFRASRARSRSGTRDDQRESFRASRARSRSGTRNDERGSRSRSRSGTRDDQRGSIHERSSRSRSRSGTRDDQRGSMRERSSRSRSRSGTRDDQRGSIRSSRSRSRSGTRDGGRQSLARSRSRSTTRGGRRPSMSTSSSHTNTSSSRRGSMTASQQLGSVRRGLQAERTAGFRRQGSAVNTQPMGSMRRLLSASERKGSVRGSMSGSSSRHEMVSASERGNGNRRQLSLSSSSHHARNEDQYDEVSIDTRDTGDLEHYDSDDASFNEEDMTAGGREYEDCQAASSKEQEEATENTDCVSEDFEKVAPSQVPPPPQLPKWSCQCGNENQGYFCCKCSAPRFWVCANPSCSYDKNKNVYKFCGMCRGTQRAKAGSNGKNVAAAVTA